jgi:putative ABC transport system permease protein
MVDRFYRFLLRLCPTDFRNEYGGEMARLFRDRCRREGTLAVLFEALPDLILTAWRQHMDTLRRDLIHSFRMIANNAGFAAAAIVSLALGIGATTAIFSVVNGVLLEPLPYRDPERLVRLYEKRVQQGRLRNSVSAPDFTDWKAQNTAFESMAALSGDRFTITGDGEPEIVRGSNVSPEFFRLLGIAPRLGRDFLPEEAAKGKDTVAILSHGIWQRRFGGDPRIVGRSVRLNGEPHTIVGVLPDVTLAIRSEAPQLDPEIWTPLVLGPDSVRSSHYLSVFARLKPGVSAPQARLDMDAVAGRLELQHVSENTGHGVNVFPVTEELVGGVRPALLILFGAVGLVLLVACANVANLALSRTVSRRREISIRAAIGAGTGRILRQLLTESLVLSLLGGAAGALLAHYGLKALALADPGNIPRLALARVDGRVLGFALAISLLTGILVGLAPAFYGAKTGLSEALRSGGRGSSGGGRHAVRNIFVVAEIALALMLSIGAGLMIQSFGRLVGVHPGYDVTNVLAVDVSLTGPKYNRREDVIVFYRDLLRRLESQPGVLSVGATTALPLTGNDPGFNFVIEGQPPLLYSQQPNGRFRSVAPGYFETMRMSLSAGRTIAPSDLTQSTLVVVVNEALVRQYFPGQNAIGKRIALSGTKDWREIVGIVADVKHLALDADVRPEMFMAFTQFAQNSMSVVVRTASAPAGLAGAVRRELAAIDRDQPIRAMRTGEEILARSVAQPRLYSALLAIFSAIGLLLAAVGVYGVMSFAVGQRTKEMGLRMALGARSGAVVAMVVKQGLRLAAAGVVVGLTGAFAVMRVLGKLLYGIAPNDGATFAGAALLLTVVAAAACYIPARRAARADPIAALRCD